jgi:hypothetical protein
MRIKRIKKEKGVRMVKVTGRGASKGVGKIRLKRHRGAGQSPARKF